MLFRSVYSWGSNNTGELGLGDYKHRETPVVIPILKGRITTRVSCGRSYVIALGETIDPTTKRFNNKFNNKEKSHYHRKRIKKSIGCQEDIELKNERSIRYHEKTKRRIDVLAEYNEDIKRGINELKQDLALLKYKPPNKMPINNVDLEKFKGKLLLEHELTNALNEEKDKIINKMNREILQIGRAHV